MRHLGQAWIRPFPPGTPPSYARYWGELVLLAAVGRGRWEAGCSLHPPRPGAGPAPRPRDRHSAALPQGRCARRSDPSEFSQASRRHDLPRKIRFAVSFRQIPSQSTTNQFEPTTHKIELTRSTPLCLLRSRANRHEYDVEEGQQDTAANASVTAMAPSVRSRRSDAGTASMSTTVCDRPSAASWSCHH